MPDTIEGEIASLIHIISGQMQERMTRRAAEMGLSRQEYMLVREIRLARGTGANTDEAYLASRANLTPASIGVVTGRLVERGFLAPGEVEDTWVLTPEGERLTGPLGIVRETVMFQMTSGLTAEEIDTLVALLRRMIEQET